MTKLRRPLTWAIAVVAILASLAFAWQGAKNASAAVHPHTVTASAPACTDFALPPGTLCNRAISVQEQINSYHQQQGATKTSTRDNPHTSDALPVEQPLAAGKLAIGFMASLGGALLVFLLAAGHVGSEWDRRTIKTLLYQNGVRWQVFAAKAASTWITAMVILIADWIVLAAASPILKAAYPLSGRGLSWGQAWSAVAADAARAPLIVAVFAIFGVAAGLVMRNTLAAFALAGGFVVTSLAAAGNLAAVAPWTLAYWVSGWMRFQSHGYVIYHFWVDGYPTSVRPPSVLTGLVGLAAVSILVTAVAHTTFRRSDVTA